MVEARTTRLLIGTVPAAVALSVAAVAGMILAAHCARPRDRRGIRRVSGAGAGAIVMLVVGILISAGEYRHGTAADTFLTTPRRSRALPPSSPLPPASAPSLVRDRNSVRRCGGSALSPRSGDAAARRRRRLASRSGYGRLHGTVRRPWRRPRCAGAQPGRRGRRRPGVAGDRRAHVGQPRSDDRPVASRRRRPSDPPDPTGRPAITAAGMVCSPHTPLSSLPSRSDSKGHEMREPPPPDRTELPAHRDQVDRTDCVVAGRRWGGVILIALVGALLVMIVVLHLTGVVGPGAH